MLLLGPVPTSAAALLELEKALAREPPQSTSFVEYRFSRLMKRAAIATGTLEYRGAGTWVRTVDSPRAERAEIADEEIRVRRGDGPERRVPLARAPQLRLLLDSLHALFDGRISQVGDTLATTLTSRDSAWRLRLEPRDPAMARQVARIDVFGTADAPTCIEMVEPDGDASFTLLGSTPAAAPSDRDAVEARCRTVALEDSAR